jgi:tRNA(Ile)-lysidine synthase
MNLMESARRTIRRHGLLPRDTRVIVALSGGADSVALLLVLGEMAAAEGFVVAGAAHLNHQLRGADADADEEFCRRMAASLGLPLDVERVAVQALASSMGVSVEQAAHDARHLFFGRAAARLGASAVAVAHTKNDQAETFLLRLIRGAGPRGLSGMHARSGLVVRPLIETPRSDVRAFLAARGADFREDATNADRSIPRNRIRHELMPLLEARYSPRMVDVLDREAAIAGEDADYLETVANDAASRLIVRTDAGVELAIQGVLAQPRAIARRVVRLAQQIASGGRFTGFDATEAVLRLAVSNSTGPLDLPGHRANLRGDFIVLTGSSGRRGFESPAAFAYALGVPGAVQVPEAACAITAAISAMPSGKSADGAWTLAGRGNEAVVEAASLTGPLSVRNRRPGDRFRPLGLHGRKKLQDWFVDAKVARAERDSIPVVVDSKGQIVWVAGHTMAEDFRVTDRTRAVVILRRIPI